MKDRSARWLVVTMLGLMATACRTPAADEDEKLAWPQTGGPTWVREGAEQELPKEPAAKKAGDEEQVQDPQAAPKAERRESPWFVFGGVSAGPQVGVTAGIGRNFKKSDSFGDIAWEVEAGYQWLSGQGEARVKQVRAGLKHTLKPEAKSHLTVRYGAIWFKTDGRVRWIDVQGGYVGGYLGAGWEWDLGEQVTTGPDVRLYLLGGQGEFEAIGQLVWNLIVKF